jgi:very-short-patch-repair endonuclease
MYILDFYCPQAKLGIELDGSHHKEPEIHALDLQKEEYIKSFGITVIRFDNVEVLKDLESVLVTITNYLK